MSISKKTIIIAIVTLFLLGGIASAFYFIWLRDNNKGAPLEKTTGDQAEETQLKTEESPTQPGVQVTTEEPVKTPPSTSGVELVAPSGSFVSNHRPSLSNTNLMNSICRTAPGASCEIRFTKGSEVKTLGPNTVGASGFVSWDWKLQDIGLTQGTWQIEAVAKSGDKQLSTKDSIPLEVQP